MSVRPAVLVCVLAAGVLAAESMTATAAAKTPVPPEAPASTELSRLDPLLTARRLVRSSATGREYVVSVSVPSNEGPAGGFAVVYVLDADAMFHTVVETVRALDRRPEAGPATRAIVVGIGYPDGTDVRVARALDLTPVEVTDRRVPSPNGGAPAFLAFLEDELKPALQTEFPIDPSRQALFGHSYGGLFTLYALTARPDAFQTWVAASPSLWYADGHMSDAVDRMATAASTPALPRRVLLTAGEYEQSLDPAKRAMPDGARVEAELRSRGQIDRGRRAVAALAAAPGTRAVFQEIAGEDHGSVIPAAISRGMRFILERPAVPPVPDAQAYWKMTPEARYALRLAVRDLPDAERIPWLNRLKAMLHSGLDRGQQEALHTERNAMDAAHGTKPHAVNAD